MLIYVLRHGITQWNKLKKVQGAMDIPLAPEGIELAKRTGEALKDVPFDICFTSPLSRARQTAECVLGDRNVPIIPDKRIQEINFGDLEGGCVRDAEGNYIDPQVEMFFRDPVNFKRPENGEDIFDVIARTKDFWEEKTSDPSLTDKTVLVASHGCAVRALLQNIYHDPENFWHGCVPPNCCVNLAEVMSGENGAERVKDYSVPMTEDLTYNYAAKAVDDKVLAALAKLAKEAQLTEKYAALYNGEVINTGEKRLVLHQLTRGQLGDKVEADGVDKREFYVKQQQRIADFANKVHAGEITNAAGEKFTTVVQIGIGGSDLGPRAMYLALENWAKKNGKFKMEAKFISNVDPDDAAAVLNSIDVAHSIFVLVSKSGTTLETLTNESFVKDALKNAGLDASRHMIAVTSETSPLAKSDDYLAAFFMDDYIGGRYSSTSAVGGAVLSLAFGPEVFAQFLDGAAAEDKLATNKDVMQNPAMLDALIGVYERNVLGYPSTAVLPYSQALSRFPAHLQQLDMESNGKSVNRFGEPVDYVTGPVIFGEPGTNGQHSFYQLLHQGTDIVPLQFIGFKNSQIGTDVVIQDSTSQQKLCANVAAQIVAFACGKEDENRNKNFEGGRPSSIIIGEQLTPEALGALLAHFENKVMFQGFLWNVNSFDQEGVQLGKVLAKRVLAHETDGALRVFSDLLNI